MNIKPVNTSLVYCRFLILFFLSAFVISINAKTYESIKVINMSGESIDLIFRINPGCGAVESGYSFSCGQKNNVKNGHKYTYLPSGGIDAAKYIEDVGVGLLGIAVGLGTGVAGDVGYAMAVKGIDEAITHGEKLPKGIMILLVFPHGKVGKGNHQAICMVPAGKSEIFIGPKLKGRNPNTDRFTCSLAPPGTAFAGQIKTHYKFENEHNEKEHMCLTYKTKAKHGKPRVKLETCRDVDNAQRWYWEKNGTFRNAKLNRECISVHDSEIKSSTCGGKNYEARAKNQKWQWGDSGRLYNERTKECLAPADFKVTTVKNQIVTMRDCKKGSAKRFQWLPGGVLVEHMALQSPDSAHFRGTTYKRIHIHNATNEKISVQFQYRPGCGAVKNNYPYTCLYRKNIKPNHGTVFHPDSGWFMGADYMETGLVTLLTSGASSAAGKGVAAGAEGAGIGSKAVSGLVSAHGFIGKKAAEHWALHQDEIPKKLMVLRIYPGGKEGYRHHQALCLVPIGTERTINIVRADRDADPAYNRYDCVVQQ